MQLKSQHMSMVSPDFSTILYNIYTIFKSNVLGRYHEIYSHNPQKLGHQTVYRALYDYTAQDYDEVSFRDGDIIQNVQPIDEGWMYGTVQRTGRSGMLPANYVEGIR